MSRNHTSVLIVGAGAAGIGAGRRLADSNVDHLVVEARDRPGGRAFTMEAGLPFPLDLGCGWFHSADVNPWVTIAEAQGRAIDRTPPPWMRPGPPIGFPLAEQQEFRAELIAFYGRLHETDPEPDTPASALVENAGRWRPLLNAVSSYVNGVELDRISIRDFSRYADSGVNWRTPDGYGAVVAAHARTVKARFGTAVTAIDRGARPLRVETTGGTITADRVIVTVPTALLAEEAIRFTPSLPDKRDAAAGLPLGLADKLFLSLRDPEEFEIETRLFGRTDTAATATYHMRPFGRPCIEVYFGGAHADALERAGEGAPLDFALNELTALLGAKFRSRVAPLTGTAWRTDPLARGSYSYALPGHAPDRERLARPVENVLFFAGEACSPDAFSTAHGAYETGVAAAEQAMASLTR
ncbi:MAG TPA: NAD(P)/FAD-dependent oxidoreductase [Bauldia sp.]|nr:NAD(P)/FAD-dependent oxidoreductase [Bauldia sp.]